MIESADIESALDWMIKNSKKAAKATADRILMIEQRKVIKAQLMKEHASKPVAAQEREAYADPRYTEHLEAMAYAIELDENFRVNYKIADSRIEAWRTMQANNRTQGKI